MLETDANVLQSGIIGKLAKLSCWIEWECEIERCPRVCAEKFTDSFDRRNEERLPFQCTPNVEGDSSTRGKNASDFLHRRSAVREILQPLLTQHHIEAAGAERQLGCAPLMPLNLSVFAGDLQHPLIYVEPTYVAELATDEVDSARNNTGATGKIEHLIAISAIGSEDEIVGPGFYNFESEARIDVGASSVSWNPLPLIVTPRR
jgi:hypothetical protein